VSSGPGSVLPGDAGGGVGPGVRGVSETRGGAGPADETPGVPLTRVMTLLGKRWTGLVLTALMAGPVNFSELRRGVPGISDRVLNERLTELTGENLVSRTVIEGPPLRVRYGLTEHGYALRPAVDELARWAEQHLTR